MTRLTVIPERGGRRVVPVVPELTLHIAIVGHLRMRLVRGWAYTHPANGEHRNKRTAAKLKAMGLMPGWPDLIFVSPEAVFHGLELKRVGGVLSGHQKAFRTHCISLGWPHAVADTIDHALAVLEQWGAIYPQAGAHA